MREDIRYNKQAITLTHASARGKVKRNAGNFTRGPSLHPCAEAGATT